MNRITLFVIFLIAPLFAFAQDGHYYISHHSPDQQAGSLCFDIAQDSNGLLYFATRVGIRQFDGRNWYPVKSASQVYTLSVNKEGRILVGGEDGIGMIMSGSDFSLDIKPIYTEKKINLFESVSTQSRAVFISDQKIITISYESNKVEKIDIPSEIKGLSTVFQLFGNVYVTSVEGTTYKIDEKQLTKVQIGLPNPVLFSSGFNNTYFAVTTTGQFFLFDSPSSPKLVSLTDAAYLKTGSVIGGVWVHSELVALSTLNGGVLFVNPRTGKTDEIINYYSGLPDNEAHNIERDASGNVWIAHEYGFSCAAPNMPLRSFNYYEGLRGNILCAITFSRRVYVGTSVGLFLLEKQTQYGEEVFYIEEKQRVVAQKDIPGTTLVASVAETEQSTKKKGYIRKKKNDPETEVVQSAATPIKKEEIEEIQYEPVKIQQTRKIQLGSSYKFRKISGADSKIHTLIEYNGRLYASGLAGLFEVNGDKTNALLREPITVLAETKEQGLVGVTYRHRVFSWKTNKQTTLVENIHDDVSSITEDKDGQIWLAGVKKIHQISIDNKQESFRYSNPTSDQTMAMSYGGDPLFVNSSNFYTYNNGAVRVIDSLGKPTQFFTSTDNLWYRVNETWKSIGTYADNKNLKYLNMFPDLRYVEADEKSEMLWLVTNTNELYMLRSDFSTPVNTPYPIFVRSVRNQNKFLQTEKPVYKIEQHESQIVIDVVQAGYNSRHGVQYRFVVDGMENATWSEWDNNNQLSFSYLPLGSYRLKIQARDLFGNISELKPIYIKITPPFWKTAWFYVMEIILFSILVLLSIRLQAMNQKYRIVAQILSMFTIILLITFIQEGFSSWFSSSTGPVTDFLIQVAVAFLVLPVETLLRRLMFSKTAKNKLQEFINPSLKKDF